MPTIRLKTGSVLGTFSKAARGLSLNFNVSGGANCAVECPHHPDSTAPDADRACYAVKLENRPDRGALLAKLQRAGMMHPEKIVGKALHELQELYQHEKLPDWLRISTDGSVPNPRDVNALKRSGL